MEHARRQYNKLLSKPYLKGLKVEDFVDFNRPFEGIADYAEEHNVDLIVMGSHGTGKINGFFVGSNTEKVVRNSKVPVFVIKKYEPEFNPKTIVFASSFKEDCHKCFGRLLDLAQIYMPDIYLLRVNTIMNFLATHESETIINDFLEKHKKEYDPKNSQSHLRRLFRPRRYLPFCR